MSKPKPEPVDPKGMGIEVTDAELSGLRTWAEGTERGCQHESLDASGGLCPDCGDDVPCEHEQEHGETYCANCGEDLTEWLTGRAEI